MSKFKTNDFKRIRVGIGASNNLSIPLCPALEPPIFIAACPTEKLKSS
ncbi:hypothetical protein [Mycoplasmopsis bovis]